MAAFGEERWKTLWCERAFSLYSAYFLGSFHVFYLMEGGQKGQEAEWKKGGAKRVSYKSEL